MSKKLQVVNVISAAEVDAYIEAKKAADEMHDRLVTKLSHGAIISNESKVELFLVNVSYPKVDWKAATKRLAKRIYGAKVGAYLHGLIIRAKTVEQTKLCSRTNRLYIPEAARQAAGD